MFFFRNEHLTVLLCVLSGSLVFASLNNDIKKIGTSSTNIVSYLPVWWKEEIKLAAQSSKSTCAAEVLAVIHAVESGQTWAMQMLDASSGFLKGNMLDLRTYVECVKVNKQYNNVSIRGKHCMVSFMSGGDIFIPAVSRVNDRIFSSVCFPSSCNETQVEQIINATLRNIPMKRNLGFSSTEALCARVETEDFSAGKISTIMLVVAVGVFLISCTVCDVYVRSRGPAKASSVINKFSKFSLYTNILKIFDSKELPAIQGIRVLSMCWIVTIHQSFMLFLVPTVNRADIDKWYDSWTSLYAEAGIFAVDTFFLVSGFLTAHSFFMARKLGKPINWRRFYLHRYLRLTPCLAFVMLFTSFLARWNGNNPLGGQFVATSVENCHDNWWVNLLYLQNFLNKEKMCLIHTWYLAAEMQLFWISSIIMYSLHRWPKYGLRLLGCFLVISVAIPPVVLATNGYFNGIIALHFEQGKIVSDGLFNFHMPTYIRGFPYFLGIFLGYDAVNTKRQLTKANAGINWTIACVLMLFCMVSTHYISNTNVRYNLALETIFALTSRPFWSIAVAWIVYACTQGYGGPVTSFLSLPFFQPLSRFSYSIFLVHIGIQAIRIADARTLAFVANSTIIEAYITNMVLSIGVGVIVYLFFETPAAVLENILTNRVLEANQALQTEEFEEKTRILNEAAKDK
ncbi:nose resistant to fluoxetine protein 6-like isoform X1 [Diprion similis]|uniref:nose resistant to fluoxetine protein 6-like isoform X1 n=1 Tax=Diprion similis TaxID=362088 RepID=UPI001EF78D68|nr:nose resistant to fluoxetine protein 6-like isoform X1 [Diprion similis]